MRWFAWLLLILAIAVGTAVVARYSDGNVAILWPPYRIDVSINLALLLLVVGFLAAHVLMRAISRMLSLRRDWRAFRERRTRERSVRALSDALRAYFEGRFGRAERLADQAASIDEQHVGVPALIAARAAHRLGEVQRRDRWLERAATDSDSHDALTITRAELLLDEGQPREALALLAEPMRAGSNLAVQRIALRAHEQAGDWEQVLQSAKSLEKRDALAPAELGRYRLHAFRGLLDNAAGSADEVRRLVGRVPAVEQKQPSVAVVLADALSRAGDAPGARKLLEHALASGGVPPPALVRRYLALGAVAAVDRLQVLERVRTREGDSAPLLLALGELCAVEGLWGKAEGYLKGSLALQESAAAHVALGHLYERLERPDEARLQFRAGAELASAQVAASDDEGMRLLPAPPSAPRLPAAGSQGSELALSTPPAAAPNSASGRTTTDAAGTTGSPSAPASPAAPASSASPVAAGAATSAEAAPAATTSRVTASAKAAPAPRPATRPAVAKDSPPGQSASTPTPPVPD